MTLVWSASLEFWMRLPKSALLDELRHAVEGQNLPVSARAEVLRAAAKLSKQALAQRVDDAWRGRRYLPDLLVTPLAAGSLTVIDSVAVAAEYTSGLARIGRRGRF